MRLSGIRRLLFVAALALSQWLVAAHAWSHPALALDPTCQICLHAPGIDAGAVAGKPPVFAAAACHETPSAAAPADAAAAATLPTRIRGPPQQQL